MSFENFIHQAWSEHHQSMDAVSTRLPQALEMMSSAEELPTFLGILSHVWGEHQGRFQDVLAQLDLAEKKFAASLSPVAKDSILRTRTVFQMLQGQNQTVSLNESDQCRVLAQTAAIWAGRKETEKSSTAFAQATALAAKLDKKDSAVRTLAIQANNTASGLESRKDRDELTTRLMLQAAKTALENWKRAGGWLETERAEYRMGMSYVQAGDSGRGLMHARNGIMICEEHKADALEFFFMQELFVRVHFLDGDRDSARRAKKLMDQHFTQMSEDNKTWCLETKTQIEKLLEESK